MMIIDKVFKFGVAWEILGRAESHNFFYGPIFLLIDDKVCPLYTRYDHTINVVFANMKFAFTRRNGWSDGSDGSELGERDVTCHEIDYDTIPNVLDIEMADLGTGYSIGPHTNIQMRVGYSGDEERVFYSLDMFKTFTEVRMPRGTVEKVIMSLPTQPDDFIKQLEQTPVRVV